MVYRAHNGMTLPSGRRVEAGEWVGEDEIPKRSVSWLKRGGHISHEPDDRTDTTDDDSGEEE